MIESVIVSKFGLENGLRAHYMPGNRKRGTWVRAKRGFLSVADALAYADEHGMVIGEVYGCEICGMFHTASPKRT